jgi:exonuclease SbcD
MVRLVDTHAILDAMGKLRDVYPNVLHLEKTGIMAVGEKRDMNREMLKRKPLDLFHDFYEQVSGQKISDDQSKALEDILSKLDAGELK